MSDLNIFITSDLTSSERRISPQWNLHYLKQRLEQITGVEPRNQVLQYFPNKYSNEFHKILNNDSGIRDEDVLLSSLGLKDYSRIHVIDSDPLSTTNQLTNESSPSNIPLAPGSSSNGAPVEGEFQLSEEEYKRRANSVLNWKAQNKLGRFNPEYQTLQAQQQAKDREALANIHVGDRCRVINISGERRGVVKYTGKIEVLDNGEKEWVGIEFDEPVGKNSGNIGTIQVFDCRPGHGSFVKPTTVEVGDFPELDPFDDMDDLDEEL